MDGRFLILLPIAFAAGIVTAVSPCVFPVLPILFAGGATGGKRRPYAIIAGLVASFATFTLIATWLLSSCTCRRTSCATSRSACCSWSRRR